MPNGGLARITHTSVRMPTRMCRKLLAMAGHGGASRTSYYYYIIVIISIIIIIYIIGDGRARRRQSNELVVAG